LKLFTHRGAPGAPLECVIAFNFYDRVAAAGGGTADRVHFDPRARSRSSDRVTVTKTETG